MTTASARVAEWDGCVRKVALYILCSVPALCVWHCFLLFCLRRPRTPGHLTACTRRRPFTHPFLRIFIHSVPRLIVLYVQDTAELREPPGWHHVITENAEWAATSRSSPIQADYQQDSLSFTHCVSFPTLRSTSDTFRRKQIPTVFPTKNTYVYFFIKLSMTWMKTFHIFLRKVF